MRVRTREHERTRTSNCQCSASRCAWRRNVHAWSPFVAQTGKPCIQMFEKSNVAAETVVLQAKGLADVQGCRNEYNVNTAGE